MDEDTKLVETSDEELEKLFADVDPEELEKAVTEGDPAPPEEKQETSQETEAKSSQSGDLGVALRQEREKLQREREARIALAARMEQMERLLSSNKEPAPSDDEQEPDPYIDTPEYVKFHTDKARQEAQAEVNKVRSQMTGELVRSKISMDEALLEKSGELDEYYDLVNLQDPDHFFAKFVEETPGILDKIYASARPAKAALDLARNAKVARDPEYAKKQESQLLEKAEKAAMKKILEKLKSKSANAKGAVGISDLSSQTGKAKQGSNDPRKMSTEDLEKAILDDD